MAKGQNRSNREVRKPKADKPASVDTSYVETAPEQRDLVNALSGTGTLKPANTYNVKSLVSGKVLTCSFEEGDNVEEGDVLYTVDSSDATTKVEQAGITLQQAQRNYDKTVDRQYVRAEVAGVVSSLKVAKGDEVTSGQEVAVIRDNSKMTLALEFPAADAAGFSVGQSADVTLDGTFETMTGTVTAVNDSVPDAPESVNQDAYAAWLFRLQPANATDLDALLDAESYLASASE